MATTTDTAVDPWSGCTTVEDERRHRQVHLAAALRVFADHGLDEGVAGHLTVRDPERRDHFWVNPFGLAFRRICVSDLLLVGPDGDVVVGERPVNRAAYAIHAAVHRARPEVMAAAHSHSRHGRAWSALGRTLDPITQDHCDFFEDHGLYDGYGGVADEPAEGERIAAALGGGKAVILRNHGLLTVGQSVDEAAWWFLRMERCCEASLLAEAAGRPVLIDPPTARSVRDAQGTALAGWFTFQPLLEQALVDHPEVLD